MASHTGSTVNPFLFNAQQFDGASGDYYLRARYYDQSNGRFLSQDPYSGNSNDPVSLHRYLYAAGDPANNCDPSGNETLSELTVTLTNQLTIAANYIGRAITIYDRIKSAADIINSAESLLDAFSNPATQTMLLDNINNFLSGFDDKVAGQFEKITGQDILDSFKDNSVRIVDTVVAAKSRSILDLANEGIKIQEFLIYMPNPIPFPKLKVTTPIKIDGIPIVLYFGGPKDNVGRVLGGGINLSGRDMQLWRMDFDYLNPFHGNPLGTGAMKKPNEYDIWEDSIFHYHVMK